MRMQHVRVVQVAPRVDMNRVIIHEVGEPLQHDAVPVVPPLLSATHQPHAGIGPLHHRRELPGLLHVVLSAERADLPFSVHLVAQSPVLHPVRFLVAVLSAQVGPVRVARAVAVLHPGLRLIHRAGAHVDHDERVGPERPAILDELVGAESVRLFPVPGKLDPAGPLLHGAYTVEPVVAADEVPAGPPQYGHAKRAEGLEYVPPEATLVAEGRTFLEDPPVDAPAQVFDKAAEDAAVDGPDPSVGIQRNPCHVRLRSVGFACVRNTGHFPVRVLGRGSRRILPTASAGPATAPEGLSERIV